MQDLKTMSSFIVIQEIDIEIIAFDTNEVLLIHCQKRTTERYKVYAFIHRHADYSEITAF